MPTLDYRRRVPRREHPDERHLIIPSFHTGALGFLPGSDIRIGLSHGHTGHETGADGRPTEVLATPFQWAPRTAFRLVATMRDSRGVVKRLLDAIWALEINILTGDTCTIGGGRLHYCELLLDWQSSPYRHLTQGRPSDTRIYADLAGRVPIDEARYLCLLKSILAMCGDVIHYDPVGIGRLPSVFMQPLADRMMHSDVMGSVTKPPSTVVEVEPADDGVAESRDAFRSSIELPPRHFDLIRRRGGWAKEDRLSYVVSSDPVTRTLRAHFLTKRSAERLVHLGFEHADDPGAVSTIAASLASAHFNLVQSLLRKRTMEQSTWEVLAVYEGDESPPPSTDQESLVGWAAEKIRTSLEPSQREHAAYYHVRVVTPRYPRREPTHGEDVAPPGTEEIGPSATTVDVSELVDAYGDVDPDRKRVYVDPDNHRTVRRALTTDVISRHVDPRPRVFLSYPGKPATEHAAVLRRLLEADGFKVVDYQVRDGQRIIEEARRRILRCDFFIGLWLPDASTDGFELPVPSPWLTLELGIAIGASGWDERNQMWSASASIDERLRARFQQDVVHWTVEATPAEFASASAQQIAAHAAAEWRDKYRFDKLELRRSVDD